MKKPRQFTEVSVSDFEKLPTLAKAQICNGMDRSEVQMLVPLFQAFRLQAGTDVYDEGDTEAFMSLIVSGTVNVIKNAGSPEEKIISTLGVGETVGEMAVIDEMPRSASAVAVTDCILYTLTRRNLLLLLKSSSLVWSKLVYNVAVALCHRLRHTTDMLNQAMVTSPVTPMTSTYKQDPFSAVKALE